jgi:hypothetical protein
MQATSGEERRLHGCAGSDGNGMMMTSSSARRRKASFIVAATMSRSFLSALMLASIESSSQAVGATGSGAITTVTPLF